MLTLDDVESDTVKRVASFWIGTTTFYAIVEGITFAFRVTQDIHVGEPQALWRGYILISIIPSFIIISLLIIATKKSIPKIEPFLRKLCHNYSYWVCIFTTVLIAYTILFVVCPDSLAIFDKFTHM